MDNWEPRGYIRTIRCYKCGGNFKVDTRYLKGSYVFSNLCEKLINLYKDEEDEISIEERCENCNERVGMRYLRMGYMRKKGGGYEMAMLCESCRGYDPVM